MLYCESKKYTFNGNCCCETMDYAASIDTLINLGNCQWWLRSPGYYQDNAAFVLDGGGVREDGNSVIYSSGAVRPAMWIDLNA